MREEWPRFSVMWIDNLGLYYDKLCETPRTFMQMFNPRNGAYQIDALITSRRAMAADWARQMWDYRMKKPLPVFIDESMTAEWGKTPSTVSEIDLIAETLGYASAWPVWDTEVQKRNALLACRHFLSGAKALQTVNRGVVIPCGFDPTRIDRIMAEQGVKPIKENDATAPALGLLPFQKERRFTCFFGGRLNRGSKRADFMLREYDSFFRFGRDVDITVCSPKEEGWILEEIEENYPEINVLIHTPSDEFVARASRAHVFLNTSASEGFSVGFAEMMYLTKYGLVLLAPRLDWVQGMFGEKYDEYPFLYEDMEQARVMLRWVHENYEEAVRQASWLGDWVAHQYDSKRTYEAHWQHYRQTLDREVDGEFVRNLMGEANRTLTLDAVSELPEVFDLDELYREMILQSRAMKDDPRRGQTTKYAVRLWLLQQGLAVDTYDSVLPRLRKIGEALEVNCGREEVAAEAGD